ncbi:MAG: glycoside hydrolase family 99-like domain-containing protein [Betaproteobacteria bacterium]
MPPEEKVKLVALYFPQFHRIPENDLWWGKGFTDWTNVKRAQPQFPGHYQPRVPKDGRYYDQSRLETIKWQVELAKSHGLFGFCHYHYWFDGKQLLETPTNLMLANKDIDFPFCLAWANEPWSRRWDGREQDLLLAQTHRPDPLLWERHFDYLFRAWSDPRAIRIDGKPVFMIYRPHLVIQLGDMLAYWTRRAQERGLPGLFFVAMKQYEYPKPELLRHFDASMHFQPFEALASPDFRWLPQEEEQQPAASVDAAVAIAADRAEPPVVKPGWFKRQWKKLPHSFRYAVHWHKRQLTDALMVVPARVFNTLSTSVQERIHALQSKRGPALVIWDYDSIWNQILKVEQDQGLTTFPGAFVDWDNTPRYGERARLFKGASPERFRFWFNQLVKVTATRPAKERIIFLNAWNEWAEGTYLEPDERYDKQYLEIVRDALAAQRK